MTGPEPPTAAPVAADERITQIDVVRGFALFGVLLANAVWWTQDAALSDGQKAALPTACIDGIARACVGLFVDGKFYTLFSFLFGLGFAVQLERAEARGVDAVALYRRRLLVLLVIGLCHNFLVWSGDVLHMYALVGLLLLLARRWSARTLAACGFALAVVVPAACEVLVAVLIPESQEKAAEEALRLEHLATLTGAGALGVVRYNVTNYLTFFTTLFFLPFLTSILGRFLLGRLAGLQRWLHDPEQHLPLFRRLFWWGLAAALLGSAEMIADWAEWWPKRSATGLLLQSLRAVARHVGVVGLSSAYLAGILLLMRWPRGRRWLGLLAPVGRMALTNYLTHSLLYLACFHDFGLDLTGRVGAAFCLAFTVVVFLLQVAFSTWWLARFQFGPAEWMWRSLTYGRRQPMRRKQAAA